MPQAAVAAEIHQPLDVHGDLAPQIARQVRQPGHPVAGHQRVGAPGRAPPSPDDLSVLAPAFVVSELRRAFTIGFVVFVPFLVVDLLVASVLLSLGLTQLSPSTIALPFKLLLFVGVDGWRLLARSLALSSSSARLFVLNKLSDTLTTIDTASAAVRLLGLRRRG